VWHCLQRGGVSWVYTGKTRLPRRVSKAFAATHHGSLQPANHEIHETLHACVTEDAGTAERAEVVNAGALHLCGDVALLHGRAP
jgi:hypothetical protein